jgi:hypothetical protein
VGSFWGGVLMFMARSRAIPEDRLALFDTGQSLAKWTTYLSGQVVLSSTQKISGTTSLRKQTADDPNGAFIPLRFPVTNYKAEFYLFGEFPRESGGADRIAILDSSGNGYGYRQVDAEPRMSMEIRNAFAGGTFLGEGAVPSGQNVWNKISITKVGSNYSFEVRSFPANSLLYSASFTDTTHSGPFSRFQIMGGRVFYTDNIKVFRLK